MLIRYLHCNIKHYFASTSNHWQKNLCGIVRQPVYCAELCGIIKLCVNCAGVFLPFRIVKCLPEVNCGARRAIVESLLERQPCSPAGAPSEVLRCAWRRVVCEYWFFVPRVCQSLGNIPASLVQTAWAQSNH